MSTNENYNNQEYHHMTKEELLDYLVNNMIEDNGVYKILVNRKEIENDPQLYHLYFRKDLKTMELEIPEDGKTIHEKLVQEIVQDDAAGSECITVIFSPEIGKRIMREKNKNAN